MNSPLTLRRFSGLWNLVLALAVFAIVSACNDRVAGGSNSTETGEEISLTGRVIDKEGSPVAGVRVSLVRLAMADTTDSTGTYHIQGKTTGKTDTLSGALDTLRFVQETRVIASLGVFHWVSAFPDVKIIQRDISGLLTGDPPGFIRVQAILMGDDIPTDHPLTADLFYNAPAQHYSGFFYFTPAPALRNYAVQIRLYDSLQRNVGRSDTIRFNSSAGNVLIPSFDSHNAIPYVYAGRDTTAKVGRSFLLRSTATDAFDGRIVKREWSLDGAPFVPVAGDTTIVLPPVRRPSANRYPAILRVTDDDGNTATDDIRITVTNDNPVITAFRDTSGVAGETLTLKVNATDPEGIKPFYTWQTIGGRLDTTVTNTLTLNLPSTSQVLKVAVTVRDNYDGISTDTLVVQVLSGGTTWTPRVSGTTQKLEAVAWTGSQFVAVGDSAVLTSPDGITWTRRTVSPGSLTTVVWTGAQLVAAGNIVVTSPDGINWTLRSSGNNFRALAWNGSLLIGVSSNGIYSSTDGVSWIQRRNSTSLRAVTWAGSMFVAVGDDGISFVSTDGISWTSQTPSDRRDVMYLAVAWTGTTLVSTTYLDEVYVSTDGLAWTKRYRGPAYFTLDRLFWVANQLIGFGDGETEAGFEDTFANTHMVFSVDQGVSWVTRKTGSKRLRGVASNGSRIVAVGGGGTIETSP
jgi:hypothetical protein